MTNARNILIRSKNGKSLAIKRLCDYGLKTPIGFTVTKQSLFEVTSALKAYSQIQFWYLRVDAMHSIHPNVVSTKDAPRVLLEFLDANPRSRVVVQERLDPVVSGALATCNDGLMIEYVRGGLRSLLRDGVSPSRMVLSKSGDIIAQERISGEFWLQWMGTTLRRRKTHTRPRKLETKLIHGLIRGAASIGPHCVSEWIIRQNGDLVFLDYKKLPASFLPSTSSVADLIVSGTLTNGPSNITIAGDTKRYMLIRRPLYSLLPNALKWRGVVVCRCGGILSHFVTYLTLKGTPVLISKRHYDRLRRLQKRVTNKCPQEKRVVKL